MIFADYLAGAGLVGLGLSVLFGRPDAFVGAAIVLGLAILCYRRSGHA